MNKFSSIEQYFINVKRFRNSCLTLLLILILVFLVVTLKKDNKNTNFKLVFEETAENNVLLKTINPVLKGSSIGGEIFKLTGKDAVQQDKDNIYLTDLIVKIISKNGNKLKAAANQAIMNCKANLLILTGNIHITFLEYNISAHKLNVDLVKKVIFGNSEVNVKSANWVVQANNIDFFYKKNILFLEGNVKFDYRPE